MTSRRLAVRVGMLLVGLLVIGVLAGRLLLTPVQGNVLVLLSARQRRASTEPVAA